jgi:hypothetical protein
MKEKIHDLKTALEVLRIEQIVSFDDCQKLMVDVHAKTGFTPPNFEISGNQWCALVNLAVARFGNTTPPQRKPLTDEEITKLMLDMLIDKKDFSGVSETFAFVVRTIEAAHGIKENA